MRSNRGFSLVEILVVMAISVILVGLVLAPVVQSFKMTRQAQAMIDAQDTARFGMEQISRELGEAMFVFDNSVVPVTIYSDGYTSAFTYKNGQEGPIQLPVRQVDDSIVCFTVPHGKIDFILPKMTMHCDNPSHPSDQPRDYPRGKEAWPPCPVCAAAGLDATNVSAKPRMPLEQDVTIVRYFLGLRYNNPSYVAQPLPQGQGVFGWRSPWLGQVQPGDENQVVLYRVEFDPYDDTLFPPNMPIDQRLTDPLFFYRATNNSEGVPCCDRWMDIARVVGIGKYQDLIDAKFDPTSGDCTEVNSSVTFRFQAINNDVFSGAYTEDRGSEYPNAVPAVHLASHGYWIGNSPDMGNLSLQQLEDESNYKFAATLYRDNNALTYYTRLDRALGGHLVIRKRAFDGTSWDTPSTTFDITDYLTTGAIPSDAEMGFTVDLNRGRIDFALVPPNLPCLLDPKQINNDFLDMYKGIGQLPDRGGAQRMAVLDHMRAPIPFAPGPPPRAGRPSPNYLKYARIVPGSERVVGPDMTPGASYVPYRPIRYERVPLSLGDPGLNQYKLDYDTGVIKFSSAPNQPLPEIPVSANTVKQIEVNYKIQFNHNGDVVAGNYTTKSLVTVHMGIRMFDPESDKPHEVDLTNSIKVRNAHR